MVTNKYRKKILTIFLPILILICGCENTQSPIKSGFPIEGNIRFNFREYFTDTVSGPKILFSMQTEKVYSFTGMNIVTTLAEGNNNYLVYMSGILPGTGFEGQAPAIWKKQMTPALGTHWINFEYLMYHTSFQFNFTDSSLVINDTSTSFMIPEYLAYWRFPVNSFAYYFVGDTNKIWVANNFVDTLLNYITLQELHFPDYGKICYINSNCCLNNVPPLKVFKYQNETDYYKAGDLFKEYKTNVTSHYTDVFISLFSWKGRVYE